MHPEYTVIYLVGRDQVLTIDSGEDAERYRWMIRGYLAAVEKAEIAISAISHHHGDHSANLRWLRDEFRAEVSVMEDAVPLLRDRLPETGVHYIHDGDEIDVGGGARLQVLHTPGHSADSVCYFLEDEGVLFTGDTILGSGSTTTVADLGDYMETLSRLRALPNLKVLCPGHGALINDPLGYIDDYVTRRNERERLILAALTERADLTSWEIMERTYTDLNPRLQRAADYQVRTHLRKLEKEGRIAVSPGKLKQPSPPDVIDPNEIEHAREIVRRADEAAERARRLVSVSAESPGMLAEWAEPPRYSLS
jgi:glyoxylase-like metal-dependent hydrolase (beta-lactamase superfamily II)